MAKDKGDDADKAAQKAEKKAAKKAARKAEKQAGKTAGEVRPAKEVIVSPLAPDRFPDLPVIKGVKFAAASAGIKYQDRTDVMLVRLPPGTSISGAFTRSSTRAGRWSGWPTRTRPPTASCPV